MAKHCTTAPSDTPRSVAGPSPFSLSGWALVFRASLVAAVCLSGCAKPETAPQVVPAVAASATTTPEYPERIDQLAADLCAESSSLATTIMTKRQEGADMAAMMKIAGTNKTSRYLVVSAYERPRFVAPEHQQRSVQDFANDMYLECLKGQGVAE